MGNIAIPGLGGGLDVAGMVSQLMYIEREPVRRLEQRKTEFQTKIDTYNDLNSKLSALLSKLETLNSAENFSARKTTSSNTDVLTASATSDAAPGTYQIAVNRLALYDNFASDATFTESTESIGTGSFDLNVGSTTTTITIDSTNNTLEGLRNVINNSGADVNASIINDGSGYRLTITSADSGSANAISITNNTLTLSDGSTAFGFTRTHNIADSSELDASLTVNGLSVTSSSNSVQDVIEGVTLNLAGTSASVTTVVVSNDTDKVKTALQDFVDAYNDAYDFINSQFTYYESVGASGTLAGDAIVREIQLELSRIVSRSVSGVSGLNTLASVGVELNNDGTLEIDASTLDDALEDNFEDVQKLFMAVGEPTHAAISYQGLTYKTEAGTYDISITQAPEAAQVTSPNAISGTLGVNEVLTLTFGSSVTTVNLTSTMTVDDVVQAVNTQLDTDGLALGASKDASNALVITSDNKGSEVSFTVVSDQASGGTGFGTTGSSASGTDVAGTFTDTETSTVYTASGSGEILTGSEGPVEGLRIRFSGSTTGSFGSLAVTIGYADSLQRMLEEFTDSLEGPITGAVEGLESNIRSIEDDINDIELRLESRERYLTDQYSRVNQALQQLSSLQATIAAQLGQLG